MTTSSPFPVVLELRGVRAQQARGAPGLARGRLHAVSLQLGAGMHAVLGLPEDGTLTLVDILGGAVRPSSGAVRIAGLDPWRSPRLRARMGMLTAHPVLPALGTVDALLGSVCAARGTSPEHVLDALGLQTLGLRPVAALSEREARAVELALALGLSEPRLIVAFEPLSELALVDPAAVAAELRTRARGGACVVAITSSTDDAAVLAEHVHVLRQGRVVSSSPVAQSPLRARHEVVVWVDGTAGPGARALGMALSAQPSLGSVTWQAAAAPGEPELVAVRAADLEQAALVVSSECARLGAVVLSLQSLVPPLDQVLRELAARMGRPT